MLSTAMIILIVGCSIFVVALIIIALCYLLVFMKKRNAGDEESCEDFEKESNESFKDLDNEYEKSSSKDESGQSSSGSSESSNDSEDKYEDDESNKDSGDESEESSKDSEDESEKSSKYSEDEYGDEEANNDSEVESEQTSRPSYMSRKETSRRQCYKPRKEHDRFSRPRRRKASDHANNILIEPLPKNILSGSSKDLYQKAHPQRGQKSKLQTEKHPRRSTTKLPRSRKPLPKNNHLGGSKTKIADRRTSSKGQYKKTSTQRERVPRSKVQIKRHPQRASTRRQLRRGSKRPLPKNNRSGGP